VRRGESTPAAGRTQQWDPFETMRRWLAWDPFQEMTPRPWRGGEERGMGFVPSFDVRETKDAYVFKADLPGFREGDVDVNMTGNRLTISGKREVEHVEDTDTYYCSERSYGAFTRSFTLPEGVNADHAQANLKEGVLTINIPKTPEAQPKRIQVGGTQGGGEKKIKA
jgi:HSP20 family protein